MTQVGAERAARNEAVFRDANERIEARGAELANVAGRTPFLCECADPFCTAVVPMTLAEYGHGRAQANTFVLAPGHATSEGRVVEETDRYVVVAEHGELAARRRADEPAPLSGERSRRIVVNERLFEAVDEGAEQYLCECSFRDCTRRIALTRAEYEEARESPDRFVMLAAHRDPVHERIVGSSDRHVLVERRS